MPAASLLSLLDDITTILDDVAILTKIAAKKTSGVLGDDLALNAEQVAGVSADRELPVVWAVAKGSAVNKVILVPAALTISGVASWLVAPLLMAGGTYLCFEGVEKLAHKIFHRNEAKSHPEPLPATPVLDAAPPAVSEKTKIRGAIRTDFVLSAEIVVITLGSVAAATFSTQVLVVATVAALMTVGVYGIVAGIVKLDDGGLYLSQRTGDSTWARLQRGVGWAILTAAPYLMRALSVVGTAAMFLVGGGILTHGVHPLHVWSEALTALAAGVPAVGWALATLARLLFDAAAGIFAGAIALAVVTAVKSVLDRFRPTRPGNEAN